MKRTLLLLVLPGLVACAAGGARRARAVEARVDHARTIPLDADHAPEYLAAWREIRDTARAPSLRAEAHYNLGCAHMRRGDAFAAVPAFEAAAAIGDGGDFRTRALYPLADLRYRRGEVRRAVALLDEFVAAGPVDRSWTAAAWYLRGKWLVELGETERAREVLREFLEGDARIVDHRGDASVRAARALLDRLEAPPAG